MNITMAVHTNLRTNEAGNEIKRATSKALKNVVVDIANDAIHGSPVLTGNNRRSIRYDIEELAASIYSTSGYGGYLETGTYKMPARPYFKPALDRNIGKLPGQIKSELK